MTSEFRLAGLVLDAPEPRDLAKFYARLLSWEIEKSDDNWISLRGPGGAKLSIQREVHHHPPVWPSTPGSQQMQIHLGFEVTDLEAAQQHALDAGATLMTWQPQEEGVRVMADPAGHVFCLFLPGW